MGSRLIFMLMVSCELAIYFGVTTMEGNFMCSVNGTTVVTNASTNCNNTGNISFIGYINSSSLENNECFTMSNSTAPQTTCSFLCSGYDSFGIEFAEKTKCFCISSPKRKFLRFVEKNVTETIIVYNHTQDIHFETTRCYGNSSPVNISFSCSGGVLNTTFSCNVSSANFSCINVNDPSVYVNSTGTARNNCPNTRSTKKSTVDASAPMSTPSTQQFVTSTAVTPTVSVNDTISTMKLETTTGSDQDDGFSIGLIIGFTIAICSLVVLVAVISTCVIRRARERRYNLQDLTNKEIEDKETLTDRNDQMQHQSPTNEHIYSDPNKKMYSKHKSQEQNQNLSSQPTAETGEYNHLDFTLRSESTQKFVSDGEYARARANTVSVFDQPWDSKPSKINKLFTSVRSSVIDSAKNFRSSFLKRETSQEISNEAMSAYENDWQPPFLRDKDYLRNTKDKTTESFSNKHGKIGEYVDIEIDKNLRTDNKPHGNGGFPVLPYSERLNVKCDNIYSEPYDRRISFRQRLSMMTSKPLKLPFGYELDFRHSGSHTPKLRAKSKIYSMAKSIDETDESLC